MSLFNISAILGLDSSEYEKGLENAESKASSFGSKLKSGLATAAKVTTAAIGAATTGVVALTKSAVDNFSSYEQLKGGIETLFGAGGKSIEEYAESVGKSTDEARDEYDQLIKAQNLVMDNASIAYKTAGMDMNKYMETTIQSAAALINSLEGDTAQAADLMDMSIVDMSDNVNKMGTTMEAVQNAYRGFSRGNFTMLDNLALGFAGTKEGMQSLLEKAEDLAIANGTLNESNMKLIIDEEEIEKATEKLETAQGKLEGRQNALTKAQLTYEEAVRKNGADSIQAQKAAISLSEANRKLEDALADVTEAEGNLEKAQSGTRKAFDIKSYSDIVKAIHIVQQEMGITGTTVTEAEGTITGSLASLRAGWQNLVTALATGEGDIDKIINDLVAGATLAIGNVLPVVERALIGIGNLIGKIAPIVIQKLPELFNSIYPSLVSAVRNMITAVVSILPGFITDFIPTIGAVIPEILGSLVQMVIDNGPTFIAGLITFVQSIADWLTENLSPFITAIIEAVSVLIGAILDNLPQFLRAIFQIVKALATAILQNIPVLISAIVRAIPQIVQAIVESLPIIIEGIAQLVVALVAALPDILKALWDGFKKLFSKQGVEQFKQMGRNLMEGLKNGFVDAVTSVIDAAKEAGKKIVNGVKKIFGIHSPSKVFENQVGRMIGAGLAEGIDKSAEEAVNSAEAMAQEVLGTMNGMDTALSTSISPASPANGAKNGLTNGGSGVTINVYGAVGQDVSELAEIISQKIAQTTQRERMAWA